MLAVIVTLALLEELASWSDSVVEREALAVPAVLPGAQMRLSLELVLHMGTEPGSQGHLPVGELSWELRK